MVSDCLCLVDAHVAIDGFKHCYFGALVGCNSIGISGWTSTEVRFYETEDGATVPIDLTSYVQTGAIRIEHANVIELQALATSSLTRRLGLGELESLALVVGRGFFFCTADQPAVRAMKELGVHDHWIHLFDICPSAQQLLPVSEVHKYTRSAVQF